MSKESNEERSRAAQAPSPPPESNSSHQTNSVDAAILIDMYVHAVYHTLYGNHWAE